MDEESRHPIGAVRFDGPPALVVRRADDRCAEPLDGPDFRVGRRVHHHDRCAGAGDPRGERDALCGVAGADRPDALRELLGGELTDRVVRAADLEGTDRLEHLEFQEDVRTARRDDANRHERRANRGAVHRFRGVTDGIDGDGSGQPS